MERPAFIEKMEINDVDFGDQVRGLGNMLMVDGALSAKTKTLMTLFGEALIRRDQGVKMVAGVARNLGATEEEINETIRLAFLMGGLPALAAASAAYPE
jgi:alkylhydroperoxidase/carboxymuconolactone decarboxylase family protein YurZ